MGRAPRTENAPLDDLDALEELHVAEEADEGEVARDVQRRPRGLRLPGGGVLPASEAWLTRLYAEERIVREKKPGVFDHLRSSGPYFVSIDDQPLSVLDAMSQTATIPGGFTDEILMRAFMDGDLNPHLLHCADTTHDEPPIARELADALREHVPGLPHVTFANAGSEANEKAMALCRANMPQTATRVLAFEGSFHGRTLLSLHATFNPAKRGPFEIPGYEATFLPYPVWLPPHEEEPEAPAGWFEEIADGDPDALSDLHADSGDPVLRQEAKILSRAHHELATGRFFACLIEPMQSEGGDRYATRRFYRALRMLTRRHQVPLIFDEVQTGFGLGGPFAWHQHFDLIDKHGRRDVPDVVVFAKRAQVGVVMSHFPDPEPTAAHPASLARGLLHSRIVDPEHARAFEKDVRERLGVIASRYPSLVSHPRGRGYAFAFDLPSPDHLRRYIAQRFYRGAVVFGAGSHTARYRLNTAFSARKLDMLFGAIDRSLRWMDENPDTDPPEWEDNTERVTRRSLPGRRVRLADASEADELIPIIMGLEERAFEAGRREPESRLRLCFEHPDGQIVVAEVPGGADWLPVGFAVSAPAEVLANVDGPKQDPRRGHNDTLYSVSIVIDRNYRGLGIGRALKRAQVDAAREARTPDGERRFHFITSRNRVGRTQAMSELNKSFGAYLVTTLDNQYGEEGAQAYYYRTPLVPAQPFVEPPERTDDKDFGSGITAPLAQAPPTLLAQLRGGMLAGPAINKITMCNYVTPAIVRALEWTSALTPDHPHLYTTSCRDEIVDKALRVFKWHRKGARVAVGVEGGYLGHTSAAARSLSDPATHQQGVAHFDWPLIPHPARAGTDAAIEELRRIVEEAGPEQVFGLFLEPLQERTGQVVPDDFWAALDTVRRDLALPVCLIETASACYRSGRGPFYSSTLDFTADAIGWWGGGQIGFLHVTPEYFVAKPLTMVSTWDGDELSLIRVHHQLRAARGLDLEATSDALTQALEPLAVPHHGTGLYRVIEAGKRAAAIQATTAKAGFRLRRLHEGRLACVPPLDVAPDTLTALAEALGELG